MSSDVLGFILTAIGIVLSLVLFLVGALMRQSRSSHEEVKGDLRKIADTQASQAVTIARVDGIVGVIVGQVDELTARMNRRDESEREGMRAELERLRRPPAA